jgi:pseudouridine-5'-phosphate glycosidase
MTHPPPSPSTAAQQQLNLASGIVIGVPIPSEYAASGEIIESAIQEALAQSREQHIAGRDVTPFLLAKVKELTHGESLKSSKCHSDSRYRTSTLTRLDVALIKNNARVGTQIAVSLATRSYLSL